MSSEPKKFKPVSMKPIGVRREVDPNMKPFNDDDMANSLAAGMSAAIEKVKNMSPAELAAQKAAEQEVLKRHGLIQIDVTDEGSKEVKPKKKGKKKGLLKKAKDLWDSL